MNLELWGFRPEHARPLAESECFARVLEEQKSYFLVATPHGELIAQLTGKMLQSDRLERPVVGDWLVVRMLQGERKAVVSEILPRHSLLRRRAAGETEAVQPLAANVELTVVVTSLNKEFNEKRLHRYLTVAQASGSRPAIVLTKKDLSPESDTQAEALSRKYSVPCVAVSAVTGEGLPLLVALFKPGETSVFVGSSGVGKSTLVNILLGREEQCTGDVRDNDDRGRHTTTSRRLVQLPSGAMVIDTPGMREIQLDSGQDAGVALSFTKIEELSRSCKFHNCKHESEPGCGVKVALESGEVLQEDFESYQKLMRETAFQERKNDKVKASDEKKKWKTITKNMRQRNKQEK